MALIKPKLADPGALILGAKRRTDTYNLCTNPDLVEEYEDLLARVAEVTRQGSDSLAGSGGQVAEFQGELDALATQIAAETVVLTFKAMPRPKYRAFVTAHPPKKNEDGEIIDPRSARVGVEYDTFFEALIRPSLVAPELDEETISHMIDEVLTASGWRELATLLWNLNESSVDVPFSPAVSRKTRTSSGK